MSDQIKTLQKLADAHRNRKNMDKAVSTLEDLAELHEALLPWLEAAGDIRDSVNAFLEASENLPAEFLPDGAQEKLVSIVESLQFFLPEEDSELAHFEESWDNVRDGHDELESMMEDRDYGAEDRDDKWYEIAEACGNIASALDYLSILGRDLQAERETQEEEATAS